MCLCMYMLLLTPSQVFNAIVEKYQSDPDFMDHMQSLQQQMLSAYTKLGLLPDIPIPSSIDTKKEPNTLIEAVELADNDTNMLSARPKLSPDAPQYIPASSFEGSKPGYYFVDGSQGLGYYVDA